MPPQAPARTGLEIDHATYTIRFVRSFDAPATLVFEAWTRPEHIRCWWDAAGEPLTSIWKLPSPIDWRSRRSTPRAGCSSPARATRRA